MGMLCFVLDLRSIPSSILRDLKLSLLQLANFYGIYSPSSTSSEAPSKPLPDRIGLCYVFSNRITSAVELKVAYSPRGYFNLRDFHHAINSLPNDAFCPEFSIAQTLPSNAEMKVSDVLNDKVLYSWGGQDKDISKKVVLICCYVIQNLDHDTKNVLMEAADKCISVEYVYIENQASHLGDVADNINSFTKQIGDLENCSFRSYLSDAYVFSVLAKQWFQELKDDTKGLLQCQFIFRTNLIHQVDHISCNLHPSLIPIKDGFTSCQTCRCHGVPLNRSNKNLNNCSLACPVIGNELDQSGVIDNSVHVGENTILCMPSFQCCQMLPQITSPIDFNVLERTTLGSLSEGVIYGSSFVVAPSTYHELDDIEKAERNNQVFLVLCHVLNSLDQGLVCCSNCNLETMTQTSLRCYYVLLPSDKGMMLLRRLVASEELLPLLDFGDAIGSKVTKEMEDSVRDSLLKIEARDYNPIQHERGFHQKLNLLVKESLQFGAMPVKAKEVATGLDITSPDSDIVQPVQGSNVEENTEERIPKLMGEVGIKKSNERLAEEWEKLIVTELPKIHSPMQFSQPKLDCLVLSPTQSAKQIDEKTSRILERLEVPKQLKRKTVSPTNLAVGNSDPFLLRKKPLIPYGSGHHDNDQGVRTSQPIKPTFQRLKRKK